MAFSQQRLMAIISAAARIAEAHGRQAADISAAIGHHQVHKTPPTALVAEINIALRNASVAPQDIMTIVEENAKLKVNWKANERIQRWRDRQARNLPPIYQPRVPPPEPSIAAFGNVMKRAKPKLTREELQRLAKDNAQDHGEPPSGHPIDLDIDLSGTEAQMLSRAARGELDPSEPL